MPTIEITEEQRERLEDVRTGLEEHRVGPYGIVRTVDAVEFLLDQYEADVDSVSETSEPDRDGVGRWEGDDEVGAETGGETAGAARGAGSDPEDAAGDAGGGPEIAPGGERGDATPGAEDGHDPSGGARSEHGGATAGVGDGPGSVIEGEQPGVTGSGPESTTEGTGDQEGTRDQGESEDESHGDGGGGGGGYEGSESGRLDAMMRLLDEHDDKWEESGAEGGRYMVTLPDGSQEGVRTKDDVRALLFKHY
jgi:hypothetical protein